MRNTGQWRLLHLIECAFVIALGAIELAGAFADRRDVHGQDLRIATFFQTGNAEDQHQLLGRAAFLRNRTGELQPNATIGRSHGAGAFHCAVAPIEIRIDGPTQSRAHETRSVGQTIQGLRRLRDGFRCTFDAGLRLLCMEFAGDQ